MDFITWLMFFLIQNVIFIGYPTYKIIQNKDDNKERKLWLLYFLCLGLFGILEGTALFPIIYL